MINKYVIFGLVILVILIYGILVFQLGQGSGYVEGYNSCYYEEADAYVPINFQI